MSVTTVYIFEYVLLVPVKLSQLHQRGFLVPQGLSLFRIRGIFVLRLCYS